MAIYIRNEDGQLNPYKIVGLKGENGVTPNITIGEVTTLEPNEQATVENVGTLENPVFNFGIPGGTISEESINLSHLSLDLQKLYVLNNETIELRDTTYTKRANLKFTSVKNSGWCQVRIPVDISNYADGDITFNIESYYKCTGNSTVNNNVTFYNTVYTCANDGSTEFLPALIKDFPNLSTFSNNESVYSGSVTFTKKSTMKYVNIYTIPKGGASGVPHTAEVGVSLSINGKKISNIEFKEGMIGDVIEVSYIEDDIPPTPEGLYLNGNFIDIDGNLLTDIIEKIKSNSNSQIDTSKHEWNGKKFNFLGDSITQGAGTTKAYHQYLLDDLQLAASRNYGISGSTISNKNNPMCTRCLNMDNDADIIFVFGGTNDFYFNVPLGEWYELSETTRSLTKDTSTFRGALNVLCNNLIDKYPSKQLVLMTPLHRNTFGSQPTEYQTNSAGLYVEDYVECIIEAGKIHSIPVIDLYSESGLRPSNQSSSNIYFTASDKLHPNTLGHKRISDLIKSKLKTIPCLS